jgi:hypothetical protein
MTIFELRDECISIALYIDALSYIRDDFHVNYDFYVNQRRSSKN